jgi:hypothetical protein
VLNPARYSGHKGFRRLTEETLDVWESWSIEARDFRWAGDRREPASEAALRQGWTNVCSIC